MLNIRLSGRIYVDLFNWTPLIVIGNRKSGNNDGELILQSFRRVLNPAQVVDICDLPPESALAWCKLVKNHTCRLLVAGGDGTIGWILNVIDRLQLQPPPQVAVLPLGTGNDLSRVLGWGDGHTGPVDVPSVLSSIRKAEPIMLDRWRLHISPATHLGIRMPTKNIYVNNYVSVGVDAHVTLKFHKTRESSFYLFKNRIFNKFLFLSYGTQDVLERACKNVHLSLVLWLDDKLIELPELESIVILNIPYWGAGAKPWGLNFSDSNIPEQKIDDGILEVFGIYSIVHVGLLQMSFSEPYRIGQAKTVKIRLHEKLPIQVDGEPWEQPPADITITHHGQVTMLKARQ